MLPVSGRRHYEVQLLYEAGIVAWSGVVRGGGAQRAMTTGGHKPAL